MSKPFTNNDHMTGIKLQDGLIIEFIWGKYFRSCYRQNLATSVFYIVLNIIFTILNSDVESKI